MKLLLFTLFFFLLSGCSKEIPLETNMTQNPNSFQSVWDKVNAHPLDTLPQEEVSFSKLFSWGKDMILQNAQRTLNNHADILPSFTKLAHPNGICFKGLWNIDTQNIYSGYFKQNSQALIIARASSAMSNTRRGEIRAFGFAGKLFPTLNPHEISHENSANFFLIDDLGGTLAPYYTEVTLTNAPSVTITSAVLKNILYALKVARTFAKVDNNPEIRQLYEISELGETDKKKSITPKWMKIEAKDMRTHHAEDFRSELSLKQGEKLTFMIFVANKIVDKHKNWKKIGTITLDTSVVSTACDKRLHFHHPKWKTDLTHN